MWNRRKWTLMPFLMTRLLSRYRFIWHSDRFQLNFLIEKENMNLFSFHSFILNGFVFVRSTPSLFYLCDVFKKTEDEVKNALQIHPHSKRYSFPVIYQNIEYLLSQGFTHEDIFNDLHIILYSV